MASTHVVFVAICLTLVTICASLPARSRVESEEAREVIVKKGAGSEVEAREVIVEIVKLVSLESVTASPDLLVKRLRRGIMDGKQCPTGEAMTPSGECAPCRGQNLPGCPKVADEEDY